MELTKGSVKYFHFTKTENLNSIFEYGLVPKVGENAKGVEDSSKVFFSESGENVLKLIDVWIRWYIVRYQRVAYVSEAVKGINPKQSPLSDLVYRQREREALDRHHKDVETGAVETDEAKRAAFKKMYKDWSNVSYLALDLKESEDFSYEDKDDAKTRQAASESDLKYLEYMYGKIENIEGLEKWNLHTFKNKGVSPENIDLVTINGKSDGLSVIQYLYEQEKIKNPDFKLSLLDEWMETIRLMQENANYLKKVETKEFLEKPGHFDYLLNQD